MTQKVLILGGAGFIGSHIADALAAQGYSIRILDILDPRVHPNGKPKYLSKEYEFIEGDICNRSIMEKTLSGVMAVFHQAAYQDYMPDYSRFFQTNVVGTALLYELIVEMKLSLKRVVVASSQAVYGEGQYHCEEHGLVLPASRSTDQMQRGDWDVVCPTCQTPMKPLQLREDYTNPFNPYALSKYGQEIAALRLGAQQGIPTVALRYSIVQGPRQSLYNTYSGICRNFSLRLLRNEPPVIFEDGEQTRDFVHIQDVVSANLMALDDDRLIGNAFNVGTGKSISVNNYAKLMAKTMGRKLEPLKCREFRVGDNRHSVSNITKLTDLGWLPQKTLEDIIIDYLGWLEGEPHLTVDFHSSYKAMKTFNVVRQVL